MRDQEPQPMNSVLGGAPGAVWLYRKNAPDGELKLAHLLATPGESAKYQNDASFEVVGVKERDIAGESALWLEWRLRTKSHIGSTGDDVQRDLAYVTSCASVDCCVTLTTKTSERIRLFGGGQRSESVIFDVRPVKDELFFAIDVRLLKVSKSDMFDGDDAKSVKTVSFGYQIGRNRCPKDED